MSEPVVTPNPSETPNPNPAGDPNTPIVASPTPAPAGNQAGEWDKERAGFLADLKKERARAQQLDQQARQFQGELEQERRRVQALAGVNPKSQSETEDAEIKAAFAAKFPHLAEVTAEDVLALRAFRDQQSSLQETTQNYWQNHGRMMVGQAETQIADELGELTDRQKSRIKREYVQFLQENADKGSVDRHEAGDEKLVQEFVKSFLEDWRDPIRRSITTQDTSRQRPVPSGRGRTSVPQSRKKVDYNDPNAFGNALVESFKDHGGQFTGQ